MATRREFPGPLSSNILDDFKAPEEATKPYQDQLLRCRQGYAALDGRWIQLRTKLLNTLELSMEETELINSFTSSMLDLHRAIYNKQEVNVPEQEPAKGTVTTY